jgi:hypothetical protein
VVASDYELKSGQVLEEILTHETSGDPVAAGQSLNLRLNPPPPFFSFYSRDKSRATQSRKIGRVAIEL